MRRTQRRDNITWSVAEFCVREASHLDLQADTIPPAVGGAMAFVCGAGLGATLFPDFDPLILALTVVLGLIGAVSVYRVVRAFKAFSRSPLQQTRLEATISAGAVNVVLIHRSFSDYTAWTLATPNANLLTSERFPQAELEAALSRPESSLDPRTASLFASDLRDELNGRVVLVP